MGYTNPQQTLVDVHQRLLRVALRVPVVLCSNVECLLRVALGAPVVLVEFLNPQHLHHPVVECLLELPSCVRNCTQLDDPGVKPGRSPLGDLHG